jgi:hypothetical protein
MVIANIYSHVVQPCFRIAVDGRLISEEPQKHFLSGIPGVLRISEQAVSGPQNHLPVRGHQPVKLLCAVVAQPNRQW